MTQERIGYDRAPHWAVACCSHCSAMAPRRIAEAAWPRIVVLDRREPEAAEYDALGLCGACAAREAGLHQPAEPEPERNLLF